MQHPPSSFAAKPRRRFRRSARVPNQIKNQIIKDPSSSLILTQSATLAIRDYNSQTQTDYQLVDIEMVNWQLVNGILYHMTFQARNADEEYGTFEATVLRKSNFRKVKRIRMKGSSTWYNGTLMQLEDDAPIIMDVKDHKRDVYDLIQGAQQFRMPDMAAVMAKQDEGAEAARALSELYLGGSGEIN